MDNITHSLVGALIGQAGLKRKTGLAMPALIIGANLPDVDAACFFWLEGEEHLGFRRGITHGPPAWVLLPLILAAILWWFDRWQTKRGKRPEGRLPVSFKWLYMLSFIGCLSHPALDWLNVYGIRLLEPFSSQWFYGDTLFIIDVWLWALMGLATWFSLRREKRGGDWKRPARVAITASLAYVFANGMITGVAENQARALVEQSYKIEPTMVVGSPVPLKFWERELLWRWDEKDEDSQGAVYGDGTFTLWGDAHFNERAYDAPTFRRTFDTPYDDTARLAVPAYQITNERLESLEQQDTQLKAFLFWSRMPVILEGNCERRPRIYDQRFRDAVQAGRFTLELPHPEWCKELSAE
ncbi:MAG: metal-dependent hydrolase [Pseudomonadota bacterium]